MFCECTIVVIGLQITEVAHDNCSSVKTISKRNFKSFDNFIYKPFTKAFAVTICYKIFCVWLSACIKALFVSQFSWPFSNSKYPHHIVARPPL